VGVVEDGWYDGGDGGGHLSWFDEFESAVIDEREWDVVFRGGGRESGGGVVDE
jgi:hypothetical protein